MTQSKEIICKKCSAKYLVKDVNLWYNHYMVCPVCNSLYSPLPKTEKKLMQLQDIFLIHKSEYAFTKMYNILRAYVKSFILKKFQFILQRNDIDYYINNILSIIYLEYAEKTDFRVRSSFGGYIFKKIQHVIYGLKEEREVGVQYISKKNKFFVKDIKIDLEKGMDWSKQTTEDYDTVIPNVTLNYVHEDGNETEIEDHSTLLEEVEKTKDKYILYNNIVDIIKISLDAHCSSDREKWMVMQRLDLFFHQGDSKVDFFNKKFGREGKEIYEDIHRQIIELLRDGCDTLLYDI